MDDIIYKLILLTWILYSIRLILLWLIIIEEISITITIRHFLITKLLLRLLHFRLLLSSHTHRRVECLLTRLCFLLWNWSHWRGLSQTLSLMTYLGLLLYDRLLINLLLLYEGSLLFYGWRRLLKLFLRRLCDHLLLRKLIRGLNFCNLLLLLLFMNWHRGLYFRRHNLLLRLCLFLKLRCLLYSLLL